MIASLPMYDRPETQGANDRLWALFREAVGYGPSALTRAPDIWTQWRSPDLLLSQTCSLPYRAHLVDTVNLVATPVQDIQCSPGHYFSHLVVRKDDPRGSLRDFTEASVVVNDWQSQSGWAALWDMAQKEGVVLQNVEPTGSHRASAQAIAEGRADLAAIDAVTWRLIRRWDEFATKLRVIGDTPPTPALPYITAGSRDPAPLREALVGAVAGLSPEDRGLLCLKSITELPKELYLSLPSPPPTCYFPQNS